jgi:hypothetical protein
MMTELCYNCGNIEKTTYMCMGCPNHVCEPCFENTLAMIQNDVTLQTMIDNAHICRCKDTSTFVCKTCMTSIELWYTFTRNKMY